MTRRGKLSLFGSIRSFARALTLLVAILWITSFFYGTYASCINYQQIIGEENDKKEDKKIKRHDEKTNKYDKKKELTIAEIEEDLLKQIEEKSGKKGLTRKWKNEELPKLEQLDREIEELAKKNDLNEEERKTLDGKKQDYKKNLEEAKEKTRKNIKEQLKDNNLKITDLDDRRSWRKSLFNDPLRFFFIAPLDRASKWLKISNFLWGEMIFKLIIIKIFYYFISYWQTSTIYEAMEKVKDPTLSNEEREKIQQEISPLLKYWLFNGLITVLFSFTLTLFHPYFLDRTHSWYLKSNEWYAKWYFWALPLLFGSFLAGISAEFLRQRRILKKQEAKAYIAKYWAINIVMGLISLLLLAFVPFGRNLGSYLFSFCSLMIDTFMNLILAKIFQTRKQKKRKISEKPIFMGSFRMPNR